MAVWELELATNQYKVMTEDSGGAGGGAASGGDAPGSTTPRVPPLNPFPASLTLRHRPPRALGFCPYFDLGCVVCVVVVYF